MNRHIFNFIKIIFALSVTAYLSATAYLYFMQDGMIFPAPSSQKEDWSSSALDEQILRTSDGEKLFALYHPPEVDEAVIIYFHGNAGTVTTHLNEANGWIDAGFGVLLLEYRGYPNSTGTPSEEGLHLDAKAAYQFIVQKGDWPIALYGFSLGTGVATRLASETDIFALVLEAPFDALQNIAASRYPILPVRTLIKHKFQSDQYISNVSAPILIMHGDLDETVPIRFGKILYDAAPEGSVFERFEGAGHSDLGKFGADSVALEFLKKNTPKGY